MEMAEDNSMLEMAINGISIKDVRNDMDYGHMLQFLKEIKSLECSTLDSIERFIMTINRFPNFAAYIGISEAGDYFETKKHDNPKYLNILDNKAGLNGIKEEIFNITSNLQASFNYEMGRIIGALDWQDKGGIRLSSAREELKNLSLRYGGLIDNAIPFCRDVSECVDGALLDYSNFIEEMKLIDERASGLAEDYKKSDLTPDDIKSLRKIFNKSVTEEFSKLERYWKNLHKGEVAPAIYGCSDRIQNAEAFERQLNTHINNFDRIKQHRLSLASGVAKMDRALDHLSSKSLSELTEEALESINDTLSSYDDSGISECGEVHYLRGIAHAYAQKHGQLAEKIGTLFEEEAEKLDTRLDSMAKGSHGMQNNLPAASLTGGIAEIIFIVQGLLSIINLYQVIKRRSGKKNNALYARSIGSSRIDGITKKASNLADLYLISAQDSYCILSSRLENALAEKDDKKATSINSELKEMIIGYTQLAEYLPRMGIEKEYGRIDAKREKKLRVLEKREVEERELKKKELDLKLAEEKRKSPVYIMQQHKKTEKKEQIKPTPNYLEKLMAESPIKTNDGSFLYDFGVLKELRPSLPMYEEIKKALLGISIPDLPRKGTWEERLGFVAKKADEYLILESREDIVYFRAVANALINSRKNGLLGTMCNDDEECHKLAKSAINSVVYLLDRSEQAIRAA